VAKLPTPYTYRSVILTWNGISLPQCAHWDISCENFVKFGPVIQQLTELILWTSGTSGQKNDAFSRISPDILDRYFAIFSPYESALRVDDGSVLYFPFFQGTLLWQPNNIAKMLSTATNTTCICCTSARKRIAISYGLAGTLTAEMMGLHRLKIWWISAW